MLHLIFTGKNISEFEQGLTFAILPLILYSKDTMEYIQGEAKYSLYVNIWQRHTNVPPF